MAQQYTEGGEVRQYQISVLCTEGLRVECKTGSVSISATGHIQLTTELISENVRVPVAAYFRQLAVSINISAD